MTGSMRARFLSVLVVNVKQLLLILMCGDFVCRSCRWRLNRLGSLQVGRAEPV